MALITCPECGQQVSDRAAVCPHCGNPISGRGVEQPAPYQQSPYPYESPKKGAPGWLIPVLIVAILALAAIIGLIVYNKPKNSEPEQPIVTTTTPVESATTVAPPVESKKPVTHRDPNTLTRYCIMTKHYGYVNVRKRPTTNSSVVKRLYDGESFYGYLPRGSNWIEYVEGSTVKGYVRQDVVRKPGQSRYFYEDEGYYEGGSSTMASDEYYGY